MGIFDWLFGKKSKDMHQKIWFLFFILDAGEKIYNIKRPSLQWTGKGMSINFYCMIVSGVKKAIEEKKYFRTVEGGDKGSNSKNYLFDINDFKKIFVPIMVGN